MVHSSAKDQLKVGDDHNVAPWVLRKQRYGSRELGNLVCLAEVHWHGGGETPFVVNKKSKTSNETSMGAVGCTLLRLESVRGWLD